MYYLTRAIAKILCLIIQFVKKDIGIRRLNRVLHNLQTNPKYPTPSKIMMGLECQKEADMQDSARGNEGRRKCGRKRNARDGERDGRHVIWTGRGTQDGRKTERDKN